MTPWHFLEYSLIGAMDALLFLFLIGTCIGIIQNSFRAMVKVVYEERLKFMSTVAEEVAKDVLSKQSADKIH